MSKTEYILTCPGSPSGLHAFNPVFRCNRCTVAFDSPYECEYANAVAAEIMRLRAEVRRLTDMLDYRAVSPSQLTDAANSTNLHW